MLHACWLRAVAFEESAPKFEMKRFGFLLSCALIQFALAIPKISRSDSTESYLKQYGISVEEHFVVTNDNYILRQFRLPRPNAPVVLLQHGVLASSWCWLVNSPEKSLGILLWNMGYDVWLTNSRGNTFSRNHTQWNPSWNKKFWNYTFDDMGYFDVVANVHKILKTTQKKDLTFVGWSQGTTQMFIAGQGPDKDYLREHVNLFVALSPVSYLTKQTSILLSVARTFRLGVILGKAYPYDVFSWAELPTLASFLCKVSLGVMIHKWHFKIGKPAQFSPFFVPTVFHPFLLFFAINKKNHFFPPVYHVLRTLGVLCEITVDVICGRSSVDNSDAITNLAGHFPAGTSVKDLEHYEQYIDWEQPWL